MHTWKHAERVIAKLVGGQRIPVSGRSGQPDVQHPWLSIEVKHRKILPQWLIQAVGQAERAARPGQLPVAVLHQHGQRYSEALVLMRLRDFEAWFGDAVGKVTPDDPK